MNKVIICGNLGGDPELRYTQSGEPVCNFTCATSSKWKDKAGNAQERTEWHKVVVWGKIAETCEKYLKKGNKVLVEGELQTRDWEDKDGQKRYTTEVKASSVQFLTAPSGGGGSDAKGRSKRSAPDDFDGNVDDSDIPF